VCTGGEEGGWPAGKGRKREGGEVAGQLEEKEREGKKRENGGLAKGGTVGKGKIWRRCGPAVDPRPKIPLVMWHICHVTNGMMWHMCHITKFLIQKKKGTNYNNKNNVFCKIFPTPTI
jgi:hypothetical protein